MKFILIFTLLPLFSYSQKFTVTIWDGVSVVLSAASGAGAAAYNAYYTDPYCFEKLGWKGKYWRHNAWENNYPGGTYDEGEQPIKPEFLNGFRDVWHGANDLHIYGTVASIGTLGVSEGIRLSKGKSKWWYTAIKFSVNQAVRITTTAYLYDKILQR